MANEEKDKRKELYSYLACLTFIVFFSRIGEIYPFFENIRINLLSFGATFMLFCFAGKYKAILWIRTSEVKLIALFLFLCAVTVPFVLPP